MSTLALVEDDHVRGGEGSSVVLVEYGDYDCPHTRAAQAIVDRIARENPDVRVVFRHFPLRHLHANAEILARIAEAASVQGKFWSMHDHLMAHRRPVDERGVVADASDAGIDMSRLQLDLESASIAERVERDVKKGRELGVHSTPSFFFDGKLHDGHYDYDTLSAKLREARAAR